MNTIKLMLVNDSPDFREALKHFLSDYTWIQVTSEQPSGEQALRYLEQENIDLVICDIHMPKMDGFELARRIKLMNKPPRIVFLTFLNTPEYRKISKNAGIDGFVDKADVAATLIPTVESIFRGKL